MPELRSLSQFSVRDNDLDRNGASNVTLFQSDGWGPNQSTLYFLLVFFKSISRSLKSCESNLYVCIFCCISAHHNRTRRNFS